MNARRINASEVEDNLVNLRQLTFEVTDACNLKCKYCGYGELYYGYDGRHSSFMSIKQVQPLMDYLFALWKDSRPRAEKPLTYFSFYGGEPLLNMKFIKEMVDFIEKSDIQRTAAFSMTTNAMLLDKYMDYLVDKDFHLLISLDGDKKGQGYRVDHNGRNSFDIVFSNIKEMQRAYPDYFKRMVNFNSVLHNRNSVQSTYEFIKKEFGKKPRISELNNSDVRPEKRQEFDIVYRNKIESLKEARDYKKISEDMFYEDPEKSDLILFIHKYSGNVFRNYNDLFFDDCSRNYTPTGTCSPFAKKMFVTVNGKILQCERISHAFSCGHVNQEGLSLNLDAIANTFNAYLDKMQPSCSACFRKKSCIQCMYYIESLHDKRPACNGFMDKASFDSYSSACLGYLKQNPELYEKIMNEVVID
ncbi:MAG: radical SAM peptide maturase [Bacteroidales bacterium]|nr:radical SAM peptide maturase [Bacteroidales bacterium]MDY6002689.1 radical SAM peptide maturase [Candidatus Cryptobacteroides sp.]